MTTEEGHHGSFPLLPALSGDHGPPTLDILSKFMTDIDQELAKQDKKIEETLEKLVEATNSLSSDNMYTNIKDAMDSLVHTSVLEECACLPPDSEDVNKLLKIIIGHISSHPGSEGVVFQQLLQVSFHEGMSLPVRAPKLETATDSSLSLNTISDTMELENDSLWGDLRGRIRKHLLEQIQSISSDELYSSPTRRVKLLQSLCVLYPVKEVWSNYESLRSRQVHQVIRQKLWDIPKESLTDSPIMPTLVDIRDRLPLLAVSLKQAMQEDFHLFMFGIFGGVVDLKTALWSIYISKLNKELQTVFDAIASKKVEAGEMANGLSALPIGKREKAPSVTSSFDESGKQIVSPFLLSKEEVQIVLSIMGHISSLNDFYKSLCYQSSWDTTLAFKLPAKGKGLLKGVLKPSKDTSTSNEPSPHDFSKRGVLPDAIPPPFGATPSMISDSSSLAVPPSDIVVETPTSQRNKWNWFCLLEKFIPGLVESLLGQMRESLSSYISAENVTWHDRYSLCAQPLAAGSVDADFIVDFQNCPITKSTAFMMSSLHLFTPLEPLWMELPLRYFKSVITDSSKECLKQLRTHLTKKWEDFVSQRALSDVAIDVREVYAVLASVTSVLEWLRGSDSWCSEEETSKQCVPIEEQFGELQSNLIREIECYHNHLIKFVILQDAASHHWEDQKPFFEGERCSYSLQMWNLHLERLRGELWSLCPPKQAASIFTSILATSLQFLSQRYCRAKPSYKRTKQLRCDILFILSAALEHLFASADSVQMVLPTSYSIQAHPLSSIHSPCTNFLSPLAIVTAPLTDLYKIFKKGFGQRQRFREEKDPDPSWMGWLWPELFERYQSISDMPDSTAVYIAVKLIGKQPTYNYPLLLQALLLRNGLLPALMAREIGKSRSDVPRYDGAPVQFERYTEDEQQLFMTMTRLLMVCTDFPKSLASFLVALVEREYSYSGNKVQESLFFDEGPLWMKCIMDLLSPCFVRCLAEAAGQLEADDSQVSSPPGFLEDLRQLPCGCRIRSKGQMLQKQEPERVLLDACRLFLSTLLTEVSSLPASFAIFVQNLEKLLPNDGSSKDQSLGLKLLVQILLLFLRDEPKVRGHLHEGLPDKIFRGLCQISKLACMLLLGKTLDGLDVPQALYNEFLKQHGEWLKDCIDKLTDHFQRKETFQHPDVVLESTTVDYQEEYYKMLHYTISSYPGVMGGLPLVYNAVADNAEWIRSIMEIPPMALFETPDEPSTFVFRNKGDCPHHRRFNPVHQVDRIGDNTFTFERLSELPLDWKELLQSEFGLTKTSFQLLLSHRHDMQEDAYLEESEKKAVKSLRAKYNLEKADFV